MGQGKIRHSTNNHPFGLAKCQEKQQQKHVAEANQNSNKHLVKSPETMPYK